jgi:hypothetical protein
MVREPSHVHYFFSVVESTPESNGYMAVCYLLFLKEQIKDHLITSSSRFRKVRIHPPDPTEIYLTSLPIIPLHSGRSTNSNDCYAVCVECS